MTGTHCSYRAMGAAIKPAPTALCLEIAKTKGLFMLNQICSPLSECGLAPSHIQATLLDAGGTPRNFHRFSEIAE